MTKTCTTCKYVSVESMCVPLEHYSYTYMLYAKNVVYSDPNDEKLNVRFDLFTCNHPDIFHVDLVSGEKRSKENMCSDLRKKDSEFCGPLGKMWLSK